MVRLVLRAVAITAVLLTLGGAKVWAGFDEGVAAYKRGDYATALRELRPLAEQGDAKAQYNLGLLYNNGDGVPQDYVEAGKWFRKAAKQGYARAQNNVGVMYNNGVGVLQDYAEAVKWYRKAAEQGNTNAQKNLGVMYVKGDGVPQDYVEALMWLDLSAAQGHKAALKVADMISLRMTLADISKAQRLAREWMEKHEAKKK